MGGIRIHRLQPLLLVGQVAQGLQTTGGGAGAERQQPATAAANGTDAIQIRRPGQAALDQGDVHRALRGEGPGLGEVHDLHLLGQRQQGLAQVEHGELAAVAGTEFVNPEAGPRAHAQNPRAPKKSAISG